MQLESNDLREGAPIDERFAFGKADPDEHMALADNISPHLNWSGAPAGTRSFVIVCMDPDVPASADDVNQEGKTLPADMERVDFCHWAMVDVAPEVTELATGACSDGVTLKGKQDPPGPAGARQGLNDYTNFLAGAEDMAGNYYGYDGPCPPWNDERVHHYEFTVYALDIDRLDVSGDFTGHDVVEALKGHVLDQASLTGTYTLNPALRD